MRYLLALIVFFLFVSCGTEYTPTVVSARKDASDIGVEIMKKGGNAFDAMIGVQLALSVSHPTAGNIAGGGFMVYKLKDGTDGTLDFRETAPADSSEKNVNTCREVIFRCEVKGRRCGCAWPVLFVSCLS